MAYGSDPGTHSALHHHLLQVLTDVSKHWPLVRLLFPALQHQAVPGGKHRQVVTPWQGPHTQSLPFECCFRTICNSEPHWSQPKCRALTMWSSPLVAFSPEGFTVFSSQHEKRYLNLRPLWWLSRKQSPYNLYKGGTNRGLLGGNK